MFRLHKQKATKSGGGGGGGGGGERVEFRFSHFKALQVPKGWDKLSVSVVSVENGKTIAKSSKVAVRNGSCQWSDAFSESVLVSGNDSSKEIDECLLKLIVAMGSSRSGILGEVTINMASYMSKSAAIPLSVPLNKCNSGTVLHVTVQCLTPRTKIRDQESSETDSDLKALNENKHDVVKSNGSDCSYVQSVGSSSLEDLDSTLSPGDIGTRATSFSGSVSNCSYTSAEGSIGMGNFSPSVNDGQSLDGRQDSSSSQKSISHQNYNANNSSSKHSSVNSPSMQEGGASSSPMTDSSDNRLEGAEDTGEELRAQAKMWEMNAQKLMDDLDMLRKEFSYQSKKLAGLEMDLSGAYEERDSLKKEVEQLKLSLEDPILRQKVSEESASQGENIPGIENALKDELKFQKESNANLSLQLKKSQEANVELVSVLKELEETLEQQKLEIDNLSSLPSKLSDLEKSFQLSIEENRSLMQQLDQLEESKKNLLVKVQDLEEALEGKMHGIEHAKSPNKKTLSDIEIEYENKLSAKEEEISSLKAKLSESLTESCNAETLSRDVEYADLMREVEILKEKIQELETDCNELTDENLELLFKLKEAQNSLKDGAASKDILSNKLKDQSFGSFESDVGNNLFRIFPSETMHQGEYTQKISTGDHISTKELETLKLDLEVRISDLNMEMINKTSEIVNLEANLSSKEKEIVVLQKKLNELETKVNDLELEKFQLQEHIDVVIKVRDINSESLHHLQKDFATLSKNMDSHLEQGKQELELHMSEIEQENEQLFRRISVLESQLRDLTDEQESCLSELEESRSQAARFREEIIEIQSELEASQEDLKQREEHCFRLGVRLRESERRFSDCFGRVEFLEKKFALVLEDIASKEKHLTSDLDGFLDESRKQMEEGQSLLNQMQMEKMIEIQSLEQEIKNLSMKLAKTYDEKEMIASKALLEVSALRADKAKLESALEEVQSKVILSKTEVNMMQNEYEQKLKDLTNELSDFRMEKEMLMEEHHKLLKLVEDYKSKELKLKSSINALELKLTVTECERQKFTDECENLKFQLEQKHQLENEFMALKNELISANSEKENLKSTLCLISELCEDLKAEKISFEVKISTLEKVVSELEDCRRTRSSLEERLTQLESDLKAVEETRCIQETELSQIKRTNRQNQLTIQLLEQEKTEFQKKAQAFEEELKQIKEQKRNQASKLNRKGLPVQEDMKASKHNPMMKNTIQNRSIRKKPSCLKNDKEIMKDQQDHHNSNKNQNEVETDHGLLDESVDIVEIDSVSKTQLLENSLTEAKEANMNGVQNRPQSQGRNNHANGSVKSVVADGELVTKERFEHTKSMLEAELSDIQERYFHMSLKYAEVEAEREQLVMKLKEANRKKWWLS